MALERILAAKREAVAKRQEHKPLARLKQGLVRSERSLQAAMITPGTSFIMEHKRASPSCGMIRTDLAPSEVARQYAGVANAISVLADEPFFAGSLDHIREVRAAVQLPVLCKDFVVDPYQVVEARLHGADAILLMLSVLDDDAMLAACLECAQELDMDALVEVRNEQELERALRHDIKLLGINNRDLDTLDVDLDTTERLAPKVPAGVVVVCESGVKHHSDVYRLRPLVDGFLVGTALMARPRQDVAARELAYGRVKVCGLTRAEDAQAAWASGATWGGLIFAEASPRLVTTQQASLIRSAAPLSWVGVFVGESDSRVVGLAHDLDLRAVQLHGPRSPQALDQLRRQLPRGCELWRACAVEASVPTRAQVGGDRPLLDTFDRRRHGGTGRCFDWSLLRDYPEMGEVVLAGGLSPENAREADRIAPWALDVNSGVEESPGRKSLGLLERFFAALRGGRGVRP